MPERAGRPPWVPAIALGYKHQLRVCKRQELLGRARGRRARLRGSSRYYHMPSKPTGLGPRRKRRRLATVSAQSALADFVGVVDRRPSTIGNRNGGQRSLCRLRSPSNITAEIPGPITTVGRTHPMIRERRGLRSVLTIGVAMRGRVVRT